MNFLKKYPFSTSWFLAMCYLLFSPTSGLPKSGLINIPHLDKIAHVVMFGTFTSLFLFDTWRNMAPIKSGFLTVLLFSLIFGLISEFIQGAFIDGREGTFPDFLADQLGFALGIVFFHFVAQKILNKHFSASQKGRTK